MSCRWVASGFALVAVIFTAGCLTSVVVDKALDSAPGIPHGYEIKGARVLERDLYLEMNRWYSTNGSASTEPPIYVKVGLDDLKLVPPSGTAACVDSPDDYPKLPVRLTEAAAFPAAALPVAVDHVRPKSLGELDAPIASMPAELAVVVVDLVGMSPWKSGRAPSFLDPAVAIVLPTEGQASWSTVTFGWSQKPNARWTWFLLTPVTAAGDIITLPLQLIPMLFMPEC